MNQLILALIIVLTITSCSTMEVLDGLCYNDREGTYLCPDLNKTPEKECPDYDPELDSSATNFCASR
jgi:hypothetical protein